MDKEEIERLIRLGWIKPGVNSGPCSVEECSRPSRTRGLCSTHYRRYRVYGDPLQGGELSPHPQGSPCPVAAPDGTTCGKPVAAKGMCSSHYYRARTHGSPTRGERRLTATEAGLIRRRYSRSDPENDAASLALEFGVSYTTINNVVSGRTHRRA